MTDGQWLRTDERQEAIKALELTVKMLGLVRDDAYYWKWAIIAFHNALQALFVIATSGSAGLGAIEPKRVAKWLGVYRSGKGNYPEIRLMNFPELYEKVKGSFGLSVSRLVDNSVQKLNSFRNEFMHFTPKGWSLELDGLPAIFENSLTVVERLISAERSPLWWYSDSQTEQFRTNYREVKESLSRLAHSESGQSFGA